MSDGLARARVERAISTLADLPLSDAEVSSDQVRVAISRLMIACNTIATSLAEAASERSSAQGDTLASAADLLWSLGEKAGQVDPGFSSADGVRPAATKRRCLREPIPAIFEAAEQLGAAVDAHLAGDRSAAEAMLRRADKPEVGEWTDSLWGKYRPDIHTFRVVVGSPPRLAKEERPQPRMPTQATRTEVLARDGHRCRFCGIPVISPEVRAALHALYPMSARWGRRNGERHFGLEAMWLQFDHVIPNQRGGDSSAANVVVTCAPCNFGRMEYTVEETGLLDPRDQANLPHHPMLLTWDGLKRLLGPSGAHGP